MAVDERDVGLGVLQLLGRADAGEAAAEHEHLWASVLHDPANSSS
jgi:hypothetical protein